MIEIVNTTHQSILSKNVLNALNERKNENGYYAGKTKFSVEDDAAELDERLRHTDELTEEENTI